MLATSRGAVHTVAGPHVVWPDTYTTAVFLCKKPSLIYFCEQSSYFCTSYTVHLICRQQMASTALITTTTEQTFRQFMIALPSPVPALSDVFACSRAMLSHIGKWVSGCFERSPVVMATSIAFCFWLGFLCFLGKWRQQLTR